MSPLKSKTYTIVSVSLLSVRLISASFCFCPSIENNLQFLVSIIFCCWSTDGLSLVFSAEVNSKGLKMLVILPDLIGIYSWMIYAIQIVLLQFVVSIKNEGEGK